MRKRLLALTLSAVSLFTFAGTGCGKVVDEIDPNKKQIYVTVWNGGFGTKWAEDLKQQFNAQNDEYEIILRKKKQNADEVANEIRLNTQKSDIYFNAYTNFQTGIYQNLYEDLSDVLQIEPDGTGTGTIQNKMLDYNSWQKVASKYGQGCYMIPWDEALISMVFDYKVFVENGWLQYADSDDVAALTEQGIVYNQNQDGTLRFVSAAGRTNYNAGDILLKAGKDGKFGTYDDGQPTTMGEFEEMLADISQGPKKAKTFLYSGKYDIYTSYIMQAVMAQYMGLDLYKAYFTYDSNGVAMPMHDGTSEVININNGYKVFKSEGVYQGLSFLKTYFDSAQIDDRSRQTTSYSHTDAQNSFILAYQKSTGFPAMLVDGTWWENEARNTFDELAEKIPSRGFGKREYRFMLLPKMNGQALADNKTAVETSENGAIVVPKTNDTAKLAKIKEFIALSLTDANLKKFTQLSGGFRPYKYDLTETELNDLTPFIRNAWEIYHDSENIDLLRTKVDKYTDPFIFASEATIYTVPIRSGATYVSSPIQYTRTHSIDALFASDNLGYSVSTWNKFLADAQREGFYNN